MQQVEWIVSDEWKVFLSSNIAEPADKLLLKFSSKGLKFRFFAAQIAARQKAKKKFPAAFFQPEIIFPEPLSIEQSSSLATGPYKADLVKSASLGIDLTGGFGIDTYFLAQKFDAFVHVEQSADLSAIAAHNFKVLGLHHIETITGNGVDYLIENTRLYDLIYLDPARRKSGKKVFGWGDCSPNIFELLPQHQNLGREWLIKGAPLLDVHQNLTTFPWPLALHIVEAAQEVKELLLHWPTEKNENQLIITNVNTQERTVLDYAATRKAIGTYALPQTYLFEPTAAWMKSGCYQWLASNFDVHQLHHDTHIFTADHYIENFPGQVFKIEQEIPLKKEAVPQQLLRIVSRNFPVTSEELRKKFKVKHGGTQVLFAVKTMEGKNVALLATQVG